MAPEDQDANRDSLAASSDAEWRRGSIEVEPDADLSWFTGALDAVGEGDALEIVADPPTNPPARGGRLADMGRLARGGMAEVRRAFDRNIRRQVAVKRVGGAESEVDDAADFLVEEAQITGQLEHPNIVPVYDLGAADGSPMFVMRLVHGHTMAAAMKDYWRGGRNPIELRELLEVLLKVCDAVAYAHGRGVVHRDLKPDNIMIAPHGQVYVMDWGCALLLAGSDAQLPSGMRSRRGQAAIVLGTPSYMAPEQARGEIDRVDPRSDVYSLGAILYQILVERPPHRMPSFVESVRAAQIGDVAAPDLLRPDLDLPPSLVAIAMRALAVEPDARFADVDALRAELDRCVAGIDWFPRRRFAAGTAILREGEDAYTAYVIESGIADVSRTVMGVTQRVRRLGRGDVFGETALFTDQVRSTTVIAETDVVAIEVTRSAFEHQIGVDSWLGMFMRSLARRFRDAERRLDASAASSLQGRVIDAVTVHLRAAGVPVGARIEARWSPLRGALARVLAVDATLVTQAVLGSADLVIDDARDRISGPA